MVFNIAGYRFVFNSLEDQVTADLEKRISAGEYSDDQLIEIRVPLNMPYYSDKDYEYIYGETDWNGEHYRFVKRKITNNTLYLLCLPNKEKTNIAKVKNDFTKSLSDTPTEKQSSHQKNSFLKLISSDYNVTRIYSAENFISRINSSFLHNNVDAKDIFDPKTEAHPPEIV